MLEIIALIFITRDIGRIAARKGLPPAKWKWICVLSWIGLEFLGAFVGLLLFGANNFFSVALLAIGFAVSSYFLIKQHLEKFPDAIDEIENIGS